MNAKKKTKVSFDTTNLVEIEPDLDENDEMEESEEDSSCEDDKENAVEVEVKIEGQEEHGVKRQRERWSEVWQFYDLLPIGDDGRERAKCKKCGKRYICETKTGTGSLKKHLSRCPRRDRTDIGQLVMNPKKGSLTVRSTKFNAERFRELISEAIIRHDLPFQFVEYDGIRAIFQYLYEDVVTISRNTAKADVLKMHKKEKIKLKKMLEIAPGRVSLTSDLWSSINTDGFVCVTSHFIDKEWKLQKRILNFQFMPPPHNGICLTEKISSLLSEWGIEKKLFTITLDNASSNDTFVELLKSQLNNENSLLSNGDYFHVRCCAHVLNLVVQDGLKSIDEGVGKVRECVKYVKGSQVRKQKFMECVKFVHLSPKKGLRQDVPTRWNATFLMIESAIFYRRAFVRLALSDSNFIHCPSEDEWSKIEKIFKFLEVFYEVTCIFSGNKYPTANLYFPSVSMVELTLKQEMKSMDGFMREMACKMYAKFSKYWSDYSLILAMAAVLDPRYKLQYVEFAYKKLYGNDSYQSVIVREKIFALFDEYMSNSSTTPSPSNSLRSDNPKLVLKNKNETVLSRSTQNMFKEFNAYESLELSCMQKSQLQMYLDEPRSDLEENLNVLSFWRAHQYRYPDLACMARDILSIPVSTVASESAFSNGGRVLDQYRSALKADTVEALICTRDWLFGVKGDEELSLHELTEDIIQVDEKSDKNPSEN